MPATRISRTVYVSLVHALPLTSRFDPSREVVRPGTRVQPRSFQYLRPHENERNYLRCKEGCRRTVDFPQRFLLEPGPANEKQIVLKKGGATYNI